MSIVFYISGHGFGHASRDVEVINQLQEPVIIRSAVNPELLARTLNTPYELLRGACDTGILQSSSIAHDDEGTIRAALTFYSDFAGRIDDEAEILSSRGVRLIVGDIAPVAFEVASRLGVPSIALGNFTWDWIYETHAGFLPLGASVLDKIRTAYAKATMALELPFSGGFEVFHDVRRLPLIARRPTQDRASTRSRFQLPDQGRVALLSFGGYGLPGLDLAAVDCRDQWTIVTTDRVSGHGSSLPSHVRAIVEREFLGSDYRYEDLVAAVDVVITKPGYGIVSECIAATTPLLYTSRGPFREYDLLVREMPRYLRTRFISQSDLFAGRWGDALEDLLRQPPAPEHIAVNGADVAAEYLMEIGKSVM